MYFHKSCGNTKKINNKSKDMELEYTIVKASSAKKLSEEVNVKIEEGWMLQGGVCMANATEIAYLQAMTLKVE